MKTLQTTLLFMLLGLMMTGANAQISSNLALEYNTNGVISAARYVAGNYGDTSQEATFLQQLLTNDSSHHFLLVSSKIDALGWTHRKYQQYYKGIRVYGGEYLTHSLGGRVKNVSGHFMPVLLANPNAQITDTAAINIGLSNIGASEYAWQDSSIEAYLRFSKGDSNATYYPKPELVIAPKELTATKDQLVWVFKVAATDPTDELLVMVDAITGVLVKKKSMTCKSNIQDTAYTKYSGTLPILTSFRISGGGHILKELRALGTSGDSVEIYTYDNKGNSYYNLSNATEIVNIDTISTTNTKIWTTPNWAGFSKDQQALDAHAANEKIIDYWYQVHQRKSYDDSLGAVNGYIHIGEKIGQQFNNAAWLGTRGDMAYGDGNGTKTRPWVALDVCAHEIGHGVCQYTAKLNLAFSEAGGLNEGFSDIWAVCIEKWANWGGNKKNWLFGEEVTILDSCIRNLKEPKKDKTPSPDCYNSPLWLKTVGQHYLAGVLRRWFYLLTEGGNGVNDLNNTYAVRGVGIDTAAAIAYRLECNLVSSSGYHDARTVSINQAKNLYGDSSYVIDAIKNAWYAVGVDSVVAIPQCLTTKPTVITSIGSDTVFNGGVYFIPNSLGIDWSVTFNNATVYVGERAALYLLNGSKLAVNGSRFTTCQGQWRGILVDLNAEVSIDGSLTSGRSSLIENADTAIALDHQMSNYSSNGNIIAVNNTIFNRNKIGISIANYTSDTLITYPFLIKNTLFTSRTIAEDSSTVWPNVATVKNSGSASAAYPATPLSYDAPYINAAAYPDALVPYTSGEEYTPYPSAGIVLNNVNAFVAGNSFGTIKIGDNGGSGQPNTLVFDNVGVGIKATKTNLTVRNCTFQNPKNEGIGIQVANEVQDNGASGVPVKFQYSLDISSDAGKPNNAFFGLNTAIHVLGGVKTTISHCDITSNQSVNDFQTQGLAGYNGIVVKSNYYDNTEISNNHVYNIRNGILFNNTMYWACTTDGINHGQLTVTNNTIGKTNPSITSTTGNEYVENAIVLSAINFSDANAANPVVCSNNTLTDVFNGVYLSQWSAVATHVDSNQVQLAAVPSNPNYEAFGICLEGSEWSNGANTVQNNQVTGSYDFSISDKPYQTGILLRMQSNTEVQCNSVSKNMNGFRFFGSNLQTKFWDNTMKADNLYGMTLDNGFIGQQGNNDANSICPSNNNWEKDSSVWDGIGKEQFMTNCINSDATQSKLVIRPNFGILNPNASWTSTNRKDTGYKYTFEDSTLISVFKDTNCTRCSGAATYFQTTTTVNSILEEIAQGIINLPADEAIERLYVMQEQLYRMLRENPELSNSNFNLQQFMYANQWQNLDFIHYLGKFMSQGNFAFVNFLLNNWTGQQNEIDNNYSHYYEIVLTLATSPEWRPDMEWLYEMANRCPLTNGIIIYAYRNLYNSLTNHIHHFENNCDGALGRGMKKGFIRLKQPPVVKKLQVNANKIMNPKSILYPNPAQDYVTLLYQHIKQVSIHSTMEKLVYNKSYNDASNVILQLGNLSKGVYLVKITGTDGETRSEKLIIQ